MNGTLKTEKEPGRIPLPITRFKADFRFARMAFYGNFFIAYVLAFVSLYPVIGLHVCALSPLLIITAAWFWGFRGGLVAGILGFPANMAINSLINGGSWASNLLGAHILGAGGSLFLGIWVGHLCDLGDRLRREITHRQKAQVMLRESEEKLRNFIESATDAFMLFDCDLNLLEINSAGLRLFPPGTTADLLRNRHILDLMANLEGNGRYQRYLQTIETGESVISEEILVDDHDNERHLSIKAFKAGSGLGFIFTDVTEQRKQQRHLKQLYDQLKRSQAHLVQSERLKSMGMMAAGVAHELNNPMMGILNYTQYCLKHTDEEDGRFQVLSDAEREIRRCIAIIQDLLMIAPRNGSRTIDKKAENVRTVFERVLRLLSYRIQRQDTDVALLIPDDLPRIHVRDNGMQHAFLNLITNALDAVAGQASRRILIEGTALNGGVQIVISDSGPGIEKQLLDKIYEPFFTTKRVGQGTGLGLSITRSIIIEHGGSITCDSQAGVGTHFKVMLPVQTEDIQGVDHGESDTGHR